MNRSQALLVIICTALLMAVSTAPSHAVIGDVYTDMDFVNLEPCVSKKYRNVDAYLEITNSSGQWRRAGTQKYEAESRQGRACFSIFLSPALFANVEETQVAYRIRIPKQKLKGRVVPARTKHVGNFKVWKKPVNNRSVPAPSHQEFVMDLSLQWYDLFGR